MPKSCPHSGSLQSGRLVQLPGNAGERGVENHGVVAHRHPHVHQHDGRQGRGRVGQPGMSTQSYRGQRPVQRSAGRVEQLEQERDHHHGQNRGQEKSGFEDVAAGHPFPEQQGQAQRRCGGDRHGDQDEQQGVSERLMEQRISEQALEVAGPDPGGVLNVQRII